MNRFFLREIRMKKKLVVDVNVIDNKKKNVHVCLFFIIMLLTTNLKKRQY